MEPLLEALGVLPPKPRGGQGAPLGALPRRHNFFRFIWNGHAPVTQCALLSGSPVGGASCAKMDETLDSRPSISSLIFQCQPHTFSFH